jgi:hypothetical protein
VLCFFVFRSWTTLMCLLLLSLQFLPLRCFACCLPVEIEWEQLWGSSTLPGWFAIRFVSASLFSFD